MQHPFIKPRGRHRITSLLLAGTLAVFTGTPTTQATDARIKDIARIDGLNGMQLVGYGVVVGLGGSGDKDLMLTKRTMANIFQQFQISMPVTDIKSKNVAAVMVTAYAPPYHQAGDTLDVQVSSIGDAISLQGGVLLMSPLLDPDGKLYALAQGGLILGGYSAGVGGAGGQTETKNCTTVGIVPGGAILREAAEANFLENGSMRLLLNHPDFTTASRMATAINERFEGSAIARDAGTVLVRVPTETLDIGQTAAFLADLEILTLKPDIQSKVIVNERTGTIVMGGDVHIGEAIVAHGNLTVSINSTLTAYMPNSFTTAKPLVTQDVVTQTREDKAKVMLIPATTTVRELADVLNEMGITPRDLISILEALHRLGALQMELTSL